VRKLEINITEDGPKAIACFQVSNPQQLRILYSILVEFTEAGVIKEGLSPEQTEELEVVLARDKEVAKYMAAEIATVLSAQGHIEQVNKYFREVIVDGKTEEEATEEMLEELKAKAEKLTEEDTECLDG